MVVRCCYCEGLLRVDEKSLPAGRLAKIRCPHCKKIGHMPEVPPSPPSAQADSGIEAPAEQRDRLRLLPLEESPPAVSEEPSIPRDAFHSFRFPAEQEENRQPAKRPTRRGLRLALWVIVSLAIVGFFALLVNLVLPGPAGVHPTFHTVPGEDLTPSQKRPATPDGQGAR